MYPLWGRSKEDLAVQARLLCGVSEIEVPLPEGATVYRSSFPPPGAPPESLVVEALRSPAGAKPLAEALSSRRDGDVVIVVSDVTRPIPYASFLPQMLAEIESAGVARDEILLLVATGMHRPSTEAERVEMFGEEIVAAYRTGDHRAEDPSGLEDLPGRSAAGSTVALDRRFVRAGFRIITGLVEPHFMAGFSGGRKAVCPGLAALDTVRSFHGAEFLGDERARNGNLEGNPLHAEALSVARLAGVDFSLNVVLDSARRVVRAFAGELEEAHMAAVEFARGCACPPVTEPADVVLTSCGGYPLDATFYQCVKGLVSALPAVREGGVIVIVAGTSEGVGGPEYSGLMERYSGDWRSFLEDIRTPGVFTKDQWQFQMHCRTLQKVGAGGIRFVSDGLSAEALSRLSVTGVHVDTADVASAVESILAETLGDGSLAVIPEGPYCTPLEGESGKPVAETG